MILSLILALLQRPGPFQVQTDGYTRRMWCVPTKTIRSHHGLTDLWSLSITRAEQSYDKLKESASQ